MFRVMQSAYIHDLEELGRANKPESRKLQFAINRNRCVSAGKAENATTPQICMSIAPTLSRFKWAETAATSPSLLIGLRTPPTQICESTNKEPVADMGQVEWTHPGMFKLECEGSWMIALCLKCCHVDE